MEVIERQKTFTLLGVKFTVKFPNVGQMIDMEALKQALTGNKYGAMSASGIKSMFYALDVVDATAFFEMMCPRIKNVLGVKSLVELSPEEMKPIIDVYKSEIAPWYNSILKELYKVTEDDKPRQEESEKEA